MVDGLSWVLFLWLLWSRLWAGGGGRRVIGIFGIVLRRKCFDIGIWRRIEGLEEEG
jgi:hypothetical protein